MLKTHGLLGPISIDEIMKSKPGAIVQSYENWLLKKGVPTVNPCITR